MFQTFSGNSRRPRQVNLSGRQNQNPFAQGSGGGFGSPSGGHGNTSDRTAALASAQQDRLARQQERERKHAATTVQRTWRGYAARRTVQLEERRRWDETEQNGTKDDVVMQESVPTITADEPSPDVPPYLSDEEALSQLNVLLHFADLRDSKDISRLERFHSRWTKTLAGRGISSLGKHWLAAYLKLERACLKAISRDGSADRETSILNILRSTAHQIPTETAANSRDFYNALVRFTVRSHKIDLDLVTVPLKVTSTPVLLAYESFAVSFLTVQLNTVLDEAEFSNLVDSINHNLLGRALADHIRKSASNSGLNLGSLSRTARLSLLGQFIYIYRKAYKFSSPAQYASGQDFILVVGTLLSSLVDEIEVEPVFSDFEDYSEASQRLREEKSVDAFVKDQISSLVNQESISGLLGLVGTRPNDDNRTETGNHSRVLASYILTLLRLFPRKGDEIRMWLYLGLNSGEDNTRRPPVIRYFWQAASASSVYQDILRDSHNAVDLLKPRQPVPQRKHRSDADDEWRVLLIFFELYMFVLKVMDDEEFFIDGRSMDSCRTLKLDEVKFLIVFLKNLGFTMYYNAPQIIDNDAEADSEDLSNIFRHTQPRSSTAKDTSAHKKENPKHIAGVQGISLDYVKGLVTGLLRQLYARDSRRPFLPADHWLLTSRFDMTNFIDAVVEEEERRNHVQQEDDEDEATEETDNSTSNRPIVGISHARQTIRVQQLQREQRKASRKRYLQAVTPRLEILQNMPFLIPFKTRVQIFRRFVYLDQLKTRHGIVDGEMWRLDQMSNPWQRNNLERHHAKIRREHEFDDAYKQYFDLGAALKQPIQITFVDKFDTVEAGIDGGGVTKEFLTSVTNQAFAPSDGVQMFVENDQHLLLPNPSAIEEQKELIRQAGLRDNQPEFREQVLDLLNRYEFLGRVLGKCLYEGILIDIGFAGFFLLKWALTGGPGFAGRESGYRPSINDLRDFDEELYQGLLKLKNYTGDVEETFSLNFTITDTISLPPTRPGGTPRQKAITRDLKPNGSSIPVTNSNRLVYISSVVRHRLASQPYLQTSAFLRGLSSIIQPSWLSMFNQSELQTLVGGAASSISISDLRRNTIYGGVYVIGDDGREHESVRIFWDVMESLPDEERRKVLKFVTSTPRAPLLGFGSLNPKFSIRDAGNDEERLPSTSTCVNLLKLPRYSSERVCRTKLLMAVNAGAGFDLS